MGKPQEVLNDFWEFVVLNQEISGWVAKVAISAPILTYFLKLAPPWPSVEGLSFLAAIVQLISLMIGFEFWKNYSPRTRKGRPAANSNEKSIARIRVHLVVWFGILLLSIFIYLVVFSKFIIPAPSHWNREVIGFSVKPEIDAWAKSQVLYPSPKDLLREFKEAERVWQEPGLTTARVIAVGSWLLLWGALAASIAAFVAIQIRRSQAGS